MPRPPLTKRQRQIVDYYAAYNREHALSPTLEEVARHFGVNKVTIFGHVAELERKGVLTRAAKGISRGRQLTFDESLGDREPARAEAAPPSKRAAAVPLLGSIAAGAPLETLEVPEEIDLLELAPPHKQIYALRVKGDSMIEDGILDGDYVLVERRSNARDGEIVVAVLPDETATLKRLYREGGNYRLQPANARLHPRIVAELEIRGVVLGVLRRL
jgi:repressor LexA